MASNLYKIDGLQTSSNGLQPNSKRNLIAMAIILYKIDGLQTSSNGLQPNGKRNLIAMASNLRAIASNLIAKGTQ